MLISVTKVCEEAVYIAYVTYTASSHILKF